MTHLEATEELSGNVGKKNHLCALPWPHNIFLVPLRTEVIHLSEAQILAMVTHGTPPDLLLWRLAGSMIAVPQDCIYLPP